MSDYDLTKKEKEVIKILAKVGPSTGYFFHGSKTPNSFASEPNKKIVSHIGWMKIRKRLQKKKLVRRIQPSHWKLDLPTDKGQEYYWLTVPAGIGEALNLGVEPGELQSTMRYLLNNDLALAIADICAKVPHVVEKVVAANIPLEALLSLPLLLKSFGLKEKETIGQIIAENSTLFERDWFKDLFESLEPIFRPSLKKLNLTISLES